MLRSGPDVVVWHLCVAPGAYRAGGKPRTCAAPLRGHAPGESGCTAPAPRARIVVRFRRTSHRAAAAPGPPRPAGAPLRLLTRRPLRAASTTTLRLSMRLCAEFPQAHARSLPHPRTRHRHLPLPGARLAPLLFLIGLRNVRLPHLDQPPPGRPFTAYIDRANAYIDRASLAEINGAASPVARPSRLSARGPLICRDGVPDPLRLRGPGVPRGRPARTRLAGEEAPFLRDDYSAGKA